MDVGTRRQTVNPSTIQQLIDQYLEDFKGAIVNHVSIQCRDQGRLLEEATRDLEVFKKAYYKAEREIHDRDARFEEEQRALNDEIHQLEEIEAREKRVVVLIDDDGAIFLPSLIAEGKNGGHDAASRLTDAARPSYPHRQDLEGSYDATASYPQIRPPPPDHRSCTPISPTTYSRTASLPYSPLTHSAAEGYDFERLGNIGPSPQHSFSRIRRNAYSAARTSFIADNPYDLDETREQMALREHLYVPNHAPASPPDSIPSPPLPPPPASSLSFTPPHTCSYHPWTFLPTACGFSGSGQGVRRNEDLTMSQGSGPGDELVPLPHSPSLKSTLRKRERQVNRSAVQVWLMGGGRSVSELVLPKADALEPRDTSPGMTAAGEKEVHPHVQGRTSEWSNHESDQLQFLPYRSVPGIQGLALGVGQSGDPTISGQSYESIPLQLPPSLTEGPQSRSRKRGVPISMDSGTVQERVTNGGLRTNFVPPKASSVQLRDASMRTMDTGEESASVEVHTCIADDTGKWDSSRVNRGGKASEGWDVAWDQEAYRNPQSLGTLYSSGIPVWKFLTNSPLTTEERISLITAIFCDYRGTEVARDLGRDDAQSFVDGIDEILDALVPQLKSRCLGTMCKVCGHHGLLPKSIQIPLCYDRTHFPLYHGGYAEVWEGEYQGCKVAVKVLKVYRTSNLDKIKRRFCKEVMVWKTLRHPNVLPLLGVTMSENQFAMASEWMVNGNINEFVKVHRDVNRFELLRDVVHGLIYVHSEGIVHGDIKGANILINGRGRACIADFGLAAIVSDTGYTTTLSSSANAGTIRWMSPERLNPDQFSVKDSRPTKKSDCYALGMVILEVLSGKVPFAQDNNDLMVMQKVLKGECPERPQEVLFTDVLWETLQACWSPQPNDRPTAEAVLECLMEVSPAWLPPSMEDGSVMTSRLLH